MTKYRVAYVDETESEIRRFQRFAHNYFDVVPIKPTAEKEETVNAIFENHVDAVVSDFDLTDQDPTIHYNGSNLLSTILEERESFPVFILTSFEEDAVSKGDDVNIVYEKNEFNDGEKFLIRVKNQIEKYYHKLEENEKRLMSLIEKSRSERLDALEEEEMKNLDRVIEKALDKKSAMPDAARTLSEGEQLTELLKRVEELTAKLTKDNE